MKAPILPGRLPGGLGAESRSAAVSKALRWEWGDLGFGVLGLKGFRVQGFKGLGFRVYTCGLFRRAFTAYRHRFSLLVFVGFRGL